MNQQELQAQLDQNLKDNELTQSKLQAEEERIKAKIKALDEPKLRHGDYGFHACGQQRLFVETISNKILHYENKPCKVDPCCCPSPSSYTITGNIFDDLEANSKDLEEFEIDDRVAYPTKLKCRETTIYGTGKCIAIEASQEGKKCTFIGDIENVTLFHQKLGRLLATQIRKQNG